MKKNNTIIMYATYSTTNDTKLTYTKTADRAEITLEFTGADPDYGTETLVCGGDPNESLYSLCESQLDELSLFLDDTFGGTVRNDTLTNEYPHLADLNNSSLIAFERMLQEITDAKVRRVITAGKTKNGHEFRLGTIREIASMVREKFIAGDVTEIYIAPTESEPDEIHEWEKIVKIDLPFNNVPTEIALMMGGMGGGNVTFAYKSFEELDAEFDSHVIGMICDSTGMSATENVYAEFIGKDDEHTYNTQKEEEVRVKTSIGTLVAKTNPFDYYPSISVGLNRNGKYFASAMIEVDQADDPRGPVLKAHVYDSNLEREDHEYPVYTAEDTPEQIDKYFEEEKFVEEA